MSRGLTCFNLLGNFGRLGNMMFQVASTIGVSKTNGSVAAANLSVVPLFKEIFQLNSVVDTLVQNLHQVYSEGKFSFDDTVFKLEQGLNVDLRGYFQTEKYFKHCENTIRQNFTFNDNIRTLAANIIPSDVCVSVHVRRGDYVNISEYHHNQTPDYYFSALERFPHHRPVFFSDDIEWCKQTFKSLPNDPVFIENTDTLNLNPAVTSDMSAYIDMCAMSFCNDHIIANSSFSWWGAWLGNGNTIAPKTWFGPKGKQDWQDIYCDGWEVI